MNYRLSLNGANGTHQWWNNFLTARGNDDLITVMLEEGLCPVFLEGLDNNTVVQHLEFKSDQHRTMFILRWS